MKSRESVRRQPAEAAAPEAVAARAAVAPAPEVARELAEVQER